ncbi:MAG: succinate dehydrogenase/fumarate reductase iron-sulfur subunit [Deltaproteobacteria bacterium]|nr:succinate dehydrogenase/fumarate reductase iron-sulfur subunit [Deltaproteobacteria bacterium]
MTQNLNLTLKIWRQANSDARGRFETYQARDVSPEMSFLEMLDFVNEELTKEGKEPIAFEHDCREGICGCCGAVVNGRAHGGLAGTTLCQVHMRHFANGSTVVIEPWRARPFKVLKDLIVDRSPFEKLQQAGGFISVNTGSAPEANSIPVKREDAELAMDAAACIGCGACVAACPNASAMLFVSAKVSHLALLPQGKAEALARAHRMVARMDELGFGNCSNEAECEAACPKRVKIANIARLNREFLKAALFGPIARKGVPSA